MTKIDFNVFANWAANFKRSARSSHMNMGLAFCNDFHITDMDVAFAGSRSEAESLIATRHIAF